MDDSKQNIQDLVEEHASKLTKSARKELQEAIQNLIYEVEDQYGQLLADNCFAEAKRIWEMDEEEFDEQHKEGYDSAMANDVPIIIDDIDKNLRKARGDD